jgi:uncharacterized protein YjbJ (UPF0337 family)
MKGSAKDAEGRLQRKAGEALGDIGQQVKGAAKQAEGKIQKGMGHARDGVELMPDMDEDKPNEHKGRG